MKKILFVLTFVSAFTSNAQNAPIKNVNDKNASIPESKLQFNASREIKITENLVGDLYQAKNKETVILLAIALELSEDELLDLLNSASYSLPKNNIFDLIIRFCFQKRIYDINKINELLFDYNCKTLN